MKQAKRESFSIVRQTCPAVDSAFNDVRSDLENDVNSYLDNLSTNLKITMEKSFDTLNSLVKEQTANLRAGLIEALDRAIEAEKRVKELEKEKSDLEDRVAELEIELKSLIDSTS